MPKGEPLRTLSHVEDRRLQIGPRDVAEDVPR
jgi:hypothetical protein